MVFSKIRISDSPTARGLGGSPCTVGMGQFPYRYKPSRHKYTANISKGIAEKVSMIILFDQLCSLAYGWVQKIFFDKASKETSSVSMLPLGLEQFMKYKENNLF